MSTETDKNQQAPDDVMRMTADIVASFVSNNPVSSDHVPEIITQVHDAIWKVANPDEAEKREKPTPAVPIGKSIHDDYLICLEDGKKLKMLKRYLRTRFDMSPEEYRAKWGLPATYPMVAPSYAKQRSSMAKKIGLGRTAAAPAPAPKRVRKKKTTK